MNKKSKALKALLEKLSKGLPEVPKQAEHIPAPKIRKKKKLNTNDKWRSLLWSIDTAEAHGSKAVEGLMQALARIVQAEILQGLLFDARPHRTAPDCPESLLWDSSTPVREDGSTMKHLLRHESGEVSLDLAYSAVIPQPWERWRLARAFQNLGPTGKHGNWRQTDNTHAVVWLPWPLAWIDNGNHTAMAAIVTHGGTVQVSESLNAKDLLLAVYSDGENWVRIDNGEIIEPVRSLAMAGIFEIGRRLVGAQKPSHST
mgnify:FL=1